MSYINFDLPSGPSNVFDKSNSSAEYTYLVLRKIEEPKQTYRSSVIPGYKQQQQTIKRLASGHYNCYNTPLRADKISSNVYAITTFFDQHLIYKIYPTASSYSSNLSNDYLFYEFDVVKKFETVSELAKSFVKDGIISNIVSALIDQSLHMTDHETAFWKAWKLINGDKLTDKLDFSTIIHALGNVTFVQRDNIIAQLISENKIDLNLEHSSFQIFDLLIAKEMYKTAVKYVKYKVQNNETVLHSVSTNSFLIANSDKTEIQELIELLKINSDKLILRIYKSNSDGTNLVNVTSVKDGDDARKYVLNNFDVKFSELIGDINNIRISIDKDTYIKFELIEDDE